ncbi:MAG: FmdB family zinc ribbon protein [Anaerolineae bacterium]
MPVYEYQCTKCGLHFDKRQRMSEPPLTECIECRGKVQRVISSVGVIFKGSGFYVNDSKSKSDGRRNGKLSKPREKTAGAGDTSPSETKGESKSETKKESATASD